MEHTPAQIRAFRHWIQGYQNFYEPIVEAYFPVAGYTVLRRPAQVGKSDIQRIIDSLFEGTKRLGPELDSAAIQTSLRNRSRLQPDFLLQCGGRRYLAELKSWGGFTVAGQFDLKLMSDYFLGPKPDSYDGAFLLVDQVDSIPIAGKVLVVSARSPVHDRVLATLRSAYNTNIELLYLDEIFKTPQLAGIIDRQCRYLDAAVAELKQAIGAWPGGDAP
ncbi:MAG: hypothetical protein ACM30E_01060 [Nitrososphaerales archaeon]